MGVGFQLILSWTNVDHPKSVIDPRHSGKSPTKTVEA